MGKVLRRGAGYEEGVWEMAYGEWNMHMFKLTIQPKSVKIIFACLVGRRWFGYAFKG